MASLAIRSVLRTCLLTPKPVSRFASTYRAATLEKPGEALVLKELKRPKLKKEQVRIKVAYCSVNSMDVKSFEDAALRVPFVPGYELAGEVVEVGSKAAKAEENFQVGDQVTAINLESFGGLAEECVVDVKDVWKVPPELPLKDAAIYVFGHSTALFTFGKLCEPSKQDNVIITVGPAGLGLAGIDIAANIYKAKVLAITNTEVQSELTRQSGAFHTLHFRDNMRDEILKLFKNKGAEIIYDSIGGHTLEEVSKCVSDYGRIFSACPASSDSIPLPPAHSSITVVNLLHLRNRELETYRQVVGDTLEMAGEGLLSAHVSEKFKFKDVNEGIKFINSNKCTGKVLVEVD